MSGSPTAQWEAPEPVTGPAPGLEFAGFGSRLLAYIVDTLILSVVLVVLLMVAAAVSPGIGILLVLIVSVAYFPWFWARGGATPGMKVTGLRVVRDADGGPVSAAKAILRLLGFYVSSIALYIGFVWIFIDKRRRGWHDLIAGTVVVKGS